MLGSSDAGFEVVAVAVDPSSPQTVYVGTSNDGITKTTDGGQTWNSVNNGLPRLDATGQITPVGQYVATAAVATDPHVPDTLYASTLGHGSCCPLMGGGGLYASRDGGSTWNPITNGLIDLNVLAIVPDPSTAGVLYAGTTRGVFSTRDGGGSWDELGFGLHDAYVGTLAIGAAGDVLYAGTVGGVFVLNVP